MGTVTLLLGIHNHQPQGNFDHVFAQGYADCYRPLLAAIEQHPDVRITLHHSGPLIEWIEDHHRDYFDTLGELVQRGQMELMGGGFYEPMLSVLPERDAQGQLTMMQDYLETRVGHRPRGMWLAERVWEPDLARVISSAGYRYTVVDDSHFLAAGMQRPLRGYYLTDKAGVPLCLFPISMELRYTIPFKPAREAVDLLLQMADEAGDGDVVVTYGDDGEKFGMWPGTKQWVWDEGWLESFFSLLEQHGDRIQTSTFSQVLRRHAPSGRVYLPTASYDEMGEWSLPAAAQGRFHELLEAVREQGHQEDWGPFVRGGIWQGFLAKYPESNFMHKRMCYVSERVARAAAAGQSQEAGLAKAVEQATTELYRGQCNCAYWHGLFGGLYLAKLRAAVHSHLIRAHALASQVLGSQGPIEMERIDVDGDLYDEVVLTGPTMGVMVSPARGGTLLAVDDRKRAFCITDVLTRRPEAYHDRVRELARSAADGAPGTDDEGPKSIHEITTLKEEGLADLLVYDPHQRLGFVDQFLPADADLDQLRRCQPEELGEFKELPYELLQAAGGTGHVALRRRAAVAADGAAAVEVTLHKSFDVDDGTLTVSYAIASERPLEGVRFATEISLALPCGPHPDARCVLFAADATWYETVTSSGVTHEAQRIELQDPHSGLTIALLPGPAATVARFPLETASQSESGIERTYQGTTIVLSWPLTTELNQRASVRLQLL